MQAGFYGFFNGMQTANCLLLLADPQWVGVLPGYLAGSYVSVGNGQSGGQNWLYKITL